VGQTKERELERGYTSSFLIHIHWSRIIFLFILFAGTMKMKEREV
jgi:hypothetical protein